MQIAGWHKCTLIDFPGKIATIVFTQGCNLRCPFCHNGELWAMKCAHVLPEREIFAFLAERQGLLDGVVVSGGEPTLQPDLADFFRKVRALGFATKLDTNGLRPNVLARLLADGLLDFVAMDVKHIPGRYADACACPVAVELVRKSLQLLKNGPAHELRTTVVPGIHRLEELPGLLDLVAGAQRFTLQNFHPKNAANPALRRQKPFPMADLEALRPIFAPAVGQFSIR
ncbi:MAG: anaerobic ribonucleoside-triphosphate reductase activating protein [Puniceicoccales bacterium]|jgi:pyruvate formate lyase activating enzyme|nr:anaerobic ribonucleoside-triphosphate reductase activating protein [Puniceicoccales bacterium]